MKRNIFKRIKLNLLNLILEFKNVEYEMEGQLLFQKKKKKKHRKHNQ